MTSKLKETANGGGDDITKLIAKVSEKSEKSKEEIEGLIAKRKEATHGLLSDYGALYAVAKEFGVSIDSSTSGASFDCAKISELKAKKPSNVLGRITALYPPKEFKRKDGSPGKLASIIVADETGDCRLVLWNNSAELVSKLNKGDVLMIRNANCKEAMRGGLELHSTTFTHFTVNPDTDVSLPEIKENKLKISNIKIGDRNVGAVCRISNYYPPKEFERKDGSAGVRTSFIGEDDTGTIRVVIWGEAARTELSRGDIVKIDDGYVKEGLNQEAELHIGNFGSIKKTDEELKLPELKEQAEGATLEIEKITKDSRGFSVTARVLTIFSQRNYTGGKFASLVIADATGSIRAVLWNEKSNIVTELSKGDALRLKNVYAKENLNSELEIHVGQYSDITVDKETEIAPISEIESALIKEKKIKDLTANDNYIRIKAKIVDLNTQKKITYMTCPQCEKTVKNLGMGWFCDICGEEIEPQPNLILAFTLEDETGSINGIAFKEQVEKILDIDREEILNMIGETQDETAPINEVKDNLIDTEVTLIGRVRYSTFSDRLEFLVSSVV